MLTRLNESGKSQTADEIVDSVQPDPTIYCTRFINIINITITIINNIINIIIYSVFIKEDFFVFHVVFQMNQKNQGNIIIVDTLFFLLLIIIH